MLQHVIQTKNGNTVKTYLDVDQFKVGDTVQIIDWSYTELGYHSHEFSRLPAEVIATHQNEIDVFETCDMETRKDLLLKWDNGRTGYCSSLCVVSATPEPKKYDNDPALIEALQPFARLGHALAEYSRFLDSKIIYQFDKAIITYGDVRNLLTALAKAEGK